MNAPSEWKIEDGKLVRQFTFDDFRQAMAFVNQVAEVAEAQNHHPDIAIAYSKVAISTWTHDANAVTEKDLTLADAINAL